jgi:hypothetical protein
MQNYLFIGGSKDGLRLPAPDDAESVQMPLGVTELANYRRETLSVGDASIYIYIHECMTPEQVLNLLIESYKARAVNRAGGRR